MPFVFGYGSLMNQPSAEKTLSRSLCSDDFQCATLHNYVRSWTASTCIRLLENGQIRPCDGLFLDLSHCPGERCNGVVVEVSEQELEILDIREKGYDRCVVELELECGRCMQGFAYVMPDCSKQHEGVIPARYIRMIDEALQAFPSTFAVMFWETTRVSQAPVVDGEYVFENCDQNAAAGRTLSAAETSG